MKRIINTLIIAAATVLALSCQEEAGVDMPLNESIVLDISSGITRAEDTSAESFVNHLDVFIFEVKDGGPGAVAYYGRYSVDNASQITLEAKRSSFPENDRYYVYLIANSTFSTSDFESVGLYDELRDYRRQEDPDIHLSGLSIQNAPKYFLMDAVAADASGASPVVLNNGIVSDNTVLMATLRRAASKVVINITASENVEFKSFGIEDGSDGGLYYIRNLPYDTFLLAESKDAENVDAKVRNTVKGVNEYFSWKPETDNRHVSLVAYVYPHAWSHESILEKETCVVMNLPLSHTSESGTTDYPNSWYKIQMTDVDMFERNRYYEVNINLNRPGAISESTPVDLEEVFYSVEDWDEMNIDVGGDEKPVYLMVNKTEMEMHNIASDASALEFASSSPVSVTVKDVYYYNKFGQHTDVSDRIVRNMNGTTDGGIAGNITVNSPVPTNNAIRYFTLVVTNEEGISREVSVAQYPLEYITNIQAYYSYRTDFMNYDAAPTTYEYKGDRIVSADWEYGSWGKYTGTGSDYFFTSKVADQNNDGTSDIYFYSYRNNSNSPVLSNSPVDGLDNARMYHVQITATSGTYKLGIPVMDADGYTDSSADNAQLVSPSFMIASQLGAVYAAGGDTQSNRNRAKTHCREYAETYVNEDGEVVSLTDWRLPTAAEIGIIVKFQTSSEVMDVVLGGRNYFCASGTVGTGITGSNDGYFLRCIRDVY